MEMVNGHQMVISLMAVSFLSKTVSARFGPELYQQLARELGGAADNIALHADPTGTDRRPRIARDAPTRLTMHRTGDTA